MGFGDVELPMGAVPALGEHSTALLEELGYPGEESGRLVGIGVVGITPAA